MVRKTASERQRAPLTSVAPGSHTMSPDEVRLFTTLPQASQALALRRWDDLAKHPARMTPSLDYYLMLVESVRKRPCEALRTVIGAPDIA